MHGTLDGELQRRRSTVLWHVRRETRREDGVADGVSVAAGVASAVAAVRSRWQRCTARGVSRPDAEPRLREHRQGLAVVQPHRTARRRLGSTRELRTGLGDLHQRHRSARRTQTCYTPFASTAPTPTAAGVHTPPPDAVALCLERWRPQRRSGGVSPPPVRVDALRVATTPRAGCPAVPTAEEQRSRPQPAPRWTSTGGSASTTEARRDADPQTLRPLPTAAIAATESGGDIADSNEADVTTRTASRVDIGGKKTMPPRESTERNKFSATHHDAEHGEAAREVAPHDAVVRHTSLREGVDCDLQTVRGVCDVG
jgi:hypothetical protein